MTSFDTVIPEARSSRPRCVLFADLVGSTGLFQAMGNTAAAELVTQATSIMSAAVMQHGGNVVKVLGDGILAVFDGPEKALSAARALREAIARGDMAVAVGVEHGDVLERDQDVFGDAVNMAARLSDVAQSGEILLGEGAYGALDYIWRAACRSLAQIALKGKAGLVAVWRFEQRDEMQTGPFLAFAHSTASIQLPAKELNQRLLITCANGQIVGYASHLQAPLSLGRAADSDVVFDDARVSRKHASITWQGDHFSVADHSSNGVSLQFAGQPTVHVLRRSRMALMGSGRMAFGAGLDGADAAVQITVAFVVDLQR